MALICNCIVPIKNKNKKSVIVLFWLLFMSLLLVLCVHIYERNANGLLFILKVVTCGNVPLESSFQKVPRCVYTSTSLFEYRKWDSKAANPKHRCFTWGLRAAEVISIC